MSISNEEITEEIITEAYSLGIHNELFIRFNLHKNYMNSSDAYRKSLDELKSEMNLLYTNKKIK